MKHNGDKSPATELDAILRSHQEYKQKQKQTAAPAPSKPAVRQPATPGTQPISQPRKPAQAQPVNDGYAQPAAAVVNEASAQIKPVVHAPAEQTAPVVSKPVEPAAKADPVVSEPVDSAAASIASKPVADEVQMPSAEDAEALEFADTLQSDSDVTGREAASDDGFETDNSNFDDDDDATTAVDDKANPFHAVLSALSDFAARVPFLKKRTEEAEDDFEDEDDSVELEDEAPAPKRRLFGRKKAAKEEEYLDFDDSDYANEDYEQEQFPADDEDSFEPELPDADTYPTAAEESYADAYTPAQPVFDESAEDIVADTLTEDDFELPTYASPTVDDTFDDDPEDNDFEDNDFEDDPDDDFDNDDFEGDAGEKKSLLSKILGVFFVRVDDDEHRYGNSLEDFLIYNAKYDEPHFEDNWANDEMPESDVDTDIEGHEGGSEMDENNSIKLEVTDHLSAGLETRGMSRRERRELADRLAAEEAARKAAEETAHALEETVDAPAETGLELTFLEEPETTINEAAADKESFEINFTENAAVPAAEEQTETFSADGPTREFKPLSRQDIVDAEQTNLFGDEDDEEEDDEPADEKRRPFAFFRSRKKADDAEEEDEDDEDLEEDEDEEEEEDEDEDEVVVKKSRRSLFGRKSSPTYEEDEEDEEEGEDEENEDEYDEYDEYDEEDYDEDGEEDYDEDEEYDDYDDEDNRPFGHHIIGFFKSLLFIIVLLLVAIVTLNFLDFFGVVPLDSVFEKYSGKAPEVFDTLFPSHKFRHETVNEETLSSIDPLVSEPTNAPVVPTATDAPAATTAPTAEPTTEPTTEPVAVG